MRKELNMVDGIEQIEKNRLIGIFEIDYFLNNKIILEANGILFVL